MKCHPFDFAQDRSEPEPFDLAQGRLRGGEESSCFNCKMLFNKNEILRRFAEGPELVEGLLRMTLTHHGQTPSLCTCETQISYETII